MWGYLQLLHTPHTEPGYSGIRMCINQHTFVDCSILWHFDSEYSEKGCILGSGCGTLEQKQHSCQEPQPTSAATAAELLPLHYGSSQCLDLAAGGIWVSAFQKHTANVQLTDDNTFGPTCKHSLFQKQSHRLSLLLSITVPLYSFYLGTALFAAHIWGFSSALQLP